MVVSPVALVAVRCFGGVVSHHVSYEEGYLRTSSEEFTTNLNANGSRHDKMVHLTNYCMQKHSKNLGKFEDGNTLK